MTVPAMLRFLGTLLATFLGALLALFAVVLLFAAAFGGSETPRVESQSVLVLDLYGPLNEVTPSSPLDDVLGDAPMPSLQATLDALEKAAVDVRIPAVWLRPDGVDAAWASLEELRAGLERFRASGKPIYASASADGFSEQDYYLATVADSVFAPPVAGFEFDGFVAQVTFFSGLLDKAGIVPQVVRAGTYKSAVEPFTRTDLSPENEQQLRALVEAVSQRFLATIAKARETSPEALQRLIGGGRVYEATDALEAGLLDALWYDDQVEALLRRHTGQDADEDLRVAYLEDYIDVPDREAGVSKPRGDDRVALVYAVGDIGTGTSDDGVLGSYTFIDALREARANENVKAVVVRIDSPGGSATASDAMWREVQRTAEVLPVIVSMGGVAASGGYYIAAPADTIVADPLTITGSIGVFSLFFEASELMNDKLGVTFDTVKTGPYADLYAGTRPLTPAETALLQRQTDAIYTTFVDRVASGRGLSPDSVRALGGGRVWTGEAAQRVGLVDVLGGLDRALALAAERAGLAEGAYDLLVLPEPESWVDRLFTSFSTRLAARARAEHPAAAWEARWAATLRPLARLAALSGTPQTRWLQDVHIY